MASGEDPDRTARPLEAVGSGFALFARIYLENLGEPPHFSINYLKIF